MTRRVKTSAGASAACCSEPSTSTQHQHPGVILSLSVKRQPDGSHRVEVYVQNPDDPLLREDLAEIRAVAWDMMLQRGMAMGQIMEHGLIEYERKAR